MDDRQELPGVTAAMRGTLLSSLLLLLAVALSIHSACDLIFDCGCRPPWSGGVSHCNIHVAHAPHCPFCEGTPFRQAALGAGIIGPGLLAIGVAARRGAPLHLTLLAGLGAAALGLLLCGLIAALATGYPTFLGLPLARIS